MDRNLGKVISKLQEKNLLGNTMIIFTSDHGDMQGAHKLRLKGVVPYKEIYNVPLIVYIPWLNSERNKITDLTSSASISATLLDAVDIDVPEDFHPSLISLLNNKEDNDQSYVFFEHYKAYWGKHPFRGIQTKQFKYVYYFEDNVEEMYDLINDPNEIVNRAKDES